MGEREWAEATTFSDALIRAHRLALMLNTTALVVEYGVVSEDDPESFAVIDGIIAITLGEWVRQHGDAFPIGARGRVTWDPSKEEFTNPEAVAVVRAVVTTRVDEGTPPRKRWALGQKPPVKSRTTHHTITEETAP